MPSALSERKRERSNDDSLAPASIPVATRGIFFASVALSCSSCSVPVPRVYIVPCSQCSTTLAYTHTAPRPRARRATRNYVGLRPRSVAVQVEIRAALPGGAHDGLRQAVRPGISSGARAWFPHPQWGRHGRAAPQRKGLGGAWLVHANHYAPQGSENVRTYIEFMALRYLK